MMGRMIAAHTLRTAKNANISSRHPPTDQYTALRSIPSAAAAASPAAGTPIADPSATVATSVNSAKLMDVRLTATSASPVNINVSRVAPGNPGSRACAA